MIIMSEKKSVIPFWWGKGKSIPIPLREKIRKPTNVGFVVASGLQPETYSLGENRSVLLSYATKHEESPQRFQINLLSPYKDR